MFSVEGKIEFIYNNERKEVEYSFCNLSGTPMFSFNDQRGKHHQFVRLNKIGWKSALNKEPKWPEDFLLVLYTAFELEFQVIYNRYSELKGNFNGV